ncbi:hypothetical protein ACI7YT_16295 [Microbacterium sp. M]|uniref:hypothetical protein n=1 Tax=Microbacterium sp. M TaxID=3377125 RepID=UPI003870AC83
MLEDPRLDVNDELRTAKILSSSLIDVSNAAVASLPSEKTLDSSEPSAATRLYVAAEQRGGGQHVLEAARLAERSLLSACDHARAFGQLIRTEKRPATALITVARGGLEAAGRSLWLTDALDVETHLHRIISMLNADLRYDVGVPDALESRTTGELVDAAERRDFYSAELTRMGLPRSKKPELSAMVQNLVAETSQLFDKKRLYSVYSGIAHGQLGGLNAFLVPAEGPSAPRLKAPLPVVTAASLQLITAIRVTADQYITWLGGPGATRPRLIDAMKRVAANTADLPMVAFANDPPETRRAGEFT